MRSRRSPDPPPGLTDHVSRREAARLLGFASDYPVRQLEKEGQLRAVRGAMGQAWYPRDAVLGLLPAPGAPAHPGSAPMAADRPPRTSPARGSWSDGELIGLLRELVTGSAADRGARRPRTVVDLVADTGINIARATRVHRFWLAHDQHPTAALARDLVGVPPGGARSVARVGERALPVMPDPTVGSVTPAGERRGPARVERDGLIRKLRDPDPAVRASAFERLRPGRKS